MKQHILPMAGASGRFPQLGIILLCFCGIIPLSAQQITGGPATTAGRAMNIYSASSAGGNPSPSLTPYIPAYFGSAGQPAAIVFNAVPPNTNLLDNSAGVMSAANFMFATTTSAAALPTSQPTSLVFTAITPTSFTVSFTPTSSPAGYLVLRKAGSASLATPSVGFTYTVGNTLADATVAYVGTNTTINESGLTPDTNYFYSVFPYNGTAATTNYLVASPLTNSQFTLATEPTGQPSFLSFSNVAATSVTVSFTAASPAPSGYIVIRRAGSASTGTPADGAAYSAGDAIGNGTVAFVGNAATFDDTGLTGGTTYFYAVYSYNGSATSSNFLTTGPATGSQKTATPDATPPTIASNTTPLTVDPGTDVTIKATVTEDASTVTGVSVDYRSVSGAAAFITKAMALTAGNSTSGTWEFTVPKAEIGELGIEYKITATNSVPLSSVATSGKTGILYKSGLMLTDSDLPPGTAETNYRIVAFPLVLSPNTVGDVFNQLGEMVKDWRVFHYQAPGPSASEWKASNLLVPGEGYWVLRRNGTDVSVLGDAQGTTVAATLAQPFTVSLQAGWNQIGNPYLFNVLWSDVLTASGLPSSQKLRTYNGNFNDGDRLRKFEGGFVNVAAATTLTFPVVRNPAAGRVGGQKSQKKMNSIDKPDWEVGITLLNGDRTNVFGGVGMHPEASLSYDQFDDFALPHFLDYVELNHGKTFINSAYSKDIVPVQQNYTWNFTVESSMEGATEMIWDNSYFGKNEKEIVLVDVESSEVVDMRAAQSYSFSSSASHQFKVVYGAKDYVLENSTPYGLTISKVFPNPSQGSVKIGFTMPNSIGQHTVQVRLVNMMGQIVTHIFDGNLSAGYHEMNWKGLDDLNQRPAQGVYFIQVSSGRESRTKRIVLN